MFLFLIKYFWTWSFYHGVSDLMAKMTFCVYFCYQTLLYMYFPYKIIFDLYIILSVKYTNLNKWSLSFSKISTVVPILVLPNIKMVSISILFIHNPYKMTYLPLFIIFFLLPFYCSNYKN